MTMKDSEGIRFDKPVDKFELVTDKQDLKRDSEGYGNEDGNNMDRGDGVESSAENELFNISRSNPEQKIKLGHRRVGTGGEVTYKKIQTSQIMGSIQLGIEHAVGGLASKPERDVLMHDFMIVETTVLPGEGSNVTPAHYYSDFIFKTYAPSAFRYFRDLFGIQPDDFLLSICSAPLRELTNPGASGSIFYLTNDDEFIIKTVQHKEGEFLQKLLPGYFLNLNQNPKTLLPKFFGLFCYQCNSKNIRMVVMNNLLPSSVTIHQKYDLKGSTYKRQASKEERQKNSPTYKDLDFIEHHQEGILLKAETYKALINTIQRDCMVLESFKIMDYSLLVGIHNLDQAAQELLESPTAQEQSAGEKTDNETSTLKSSINLNRSQLVNRQRLVAHSTAMESIQAEVDPIYEEENLPPGGIPARNGKGERLLVYVGIIDILQSYGIKKKLEHAWKSILHDGDTVSVHRPGFYSERFQSFMANTVFKKIPSIIKRSLSKRTGVSRPRNSENNEELGFASISRMSRFGGASSTIFSSTPSRPHFSPLSLRKVKKNQEEMKFRGFSDHVEIMYQEDSISISEVRLESHSDIKSSLSVGSGSSTSGVGSGWRLAWTPPASVTGSTPTWTEGTPSFTESSCSEDIDCLSTQVHGLHQQKESFKTNINIPTCM